MRRPLAIDLALGLILFAAGAAIALQFLHAEPRRSYFFDWELTPATFMACGQSFSQPSAPIDTLTAFTARQAETFDCPAIAGGGPVIAASALANQNRYGLLGPALAMAINGVSWRTLDFYVAALFGLSTALSYALLRNFTMRGVAVIGALALAMSTRVPEIVSHRDYIKEPPFLALLVILAWLCAQERRARALWIGAGIGGLVLGIGIGCRADLMIFAPFFAAALLIFVKVAGDRRLRDRFVAMALFASGFAVTATPILRTVSGGSNLSHTVLLGFMTPFTTHLGLKIPAYDVGAIYSDGYIYTLIAAQARLREHDLGPVPFGQPEYDQAGARLFLDIARQFPADMLARAYGAVLQSLAHPFKADTLIYSRATPGFADSAILRTAANWRERAFGLVEERGVWLSLAALLIAAAVNLRVAIFAAAAAIYFCGYSMLQFSQRHTFHLDVFGVTAAMFLVHAVAWSVWKLSRGHWPPPEAWRRSMINVGLFAIASTLLLATPLAIVRWSQQHSVARAIDATIAAANVDAPFSVAPFQAGTVLAASDALGQRKGPGPIDDVRDVRMDFVAADFGGAGCGDAPFPVELKYTGVVVTLDKEFNRTMTVAPEPDGRTVRLLVPFFYEFGPYWLHADGLVLPAERAGCLRKMQRVERPGELPFPFLYAVLAADWVRSPLYQRFAWE